MIPLVLQLATLTACAVIVLRAEPALDRMGAGTPLTIRLAIHALTVGAVAEAGCITLFRDVPSWPEVILTAGIALLLVCERRIRVLVRGPRERVEQGRGAA